MQTSSLDSTAPARLLLAIALLWPAAALADALTDEYPSALLQEAIAAIDEDYRDHWAFTETAIDSEATVIGRFDPRRGGEDRWQLISVDGRAPTADEAETFRIDKAGEMAADGPADEDEAEAEVGEMVRPDTLSLIEETADYWLFSFVPENDDDEDFLEMMQGTLRIAKDGRYLEHINIESSGPFKPAFGVKVHRFLTRLTFGPAVAGGPIVPRSVAFNVKVRAYLLMNVDESGSVTWSDFEYVGD